jgi:hypothetical protein
MMSLQNINSLLLRSLTWTANCVGSEKRVGHFNPARARPGSIGSIPCMNQSGSGLPLKPPSPLPQVASDLDATNISSYSLSQEVLVRHCCMTSKDELDQIIFQSNLVHVPSLDNDGEDSTSSDAFIDSRLNIDIDERSVIEDSCLNSKISSPESISNCDSHDLEGKERSYTYLKRADFEHYDDANLFLPPGPLAITPSRPVTHSSSNFLARCSRDYLEKEMERALQNHGAIQSRCKTRFLIRIVIQLWKSTISKKVSDHAKLRLAAYKSRLTTLHFSFQRILSYANDRARSSQRRRRLDKRRMSRLLRNLFLSWRRVLSVYQHHTSASVVSHRELEAENNEMLSLLGKHKRLSSHQHGLIKSLRQKLESTELELGSTVLQQRHVIDEMRLRSVCDAKVAKSLQRKMLADADEIRRLKRGNALLQARLQTLSSSSPLPGIDKIN